MIRLDVGNFPNALLPFLSEKLPKIGRVFAQGIAARLPFFVALEMEFARIFGRNAHGIEIKNIIVGFGEPKQRFVSAGKPIGSVQSVIEVPDDSIAKFQAQFVKDWIKENIQRKHFAFVHIIANLPAETSIMFEERNEFGNDLLLSVEITIECCLLLILFADIVGR